MVGQNIGEDAESLRGVYVTPYANPTSVKHGRDAGFISGDPHLS